MGHRCQCPIHGLRQYRRQIRFRRRLHPRPGQRRKGVLRRISHQRPGRRRGGRRAHAQAGGRTWSKSCPKPPRNWNGSAKPSKAISATCRISSSPSKTARSSCSRPATANAPAWPPSVLRWRWRRRGLITWEEAVQRVPAEQLDQVLAPVFDRAAVKAAKCIARGLPAGPGAATGRIYFNADRAVEAAHHGEKVLLVRVETSPEDLRGMIAAEGILTARGGVSSHAALVARQMGKVCVCGASALQVDYQAKTNERRRPDSSTKGISSRLTAPSGEVYAGRTQDRPVGNHPGAGRKNACKPRKAAPSRYYAN